MLISQYTDKTNEQHHHFMVHEYLERYKNQNEILFNTVMYKKGTDIIEESQQLKLAVSLAQLGKRLVIKEIQLVYSKIENDYPGLFVFDISES